jgi:hypothetical protein
VRLGQIGNIANDQAGMGRIAFAYHRELILQFGGTALQLRRPRVHLGRDDGDNAGAAAEARRRDLTSTFR